MQDEEKTLEKLSTIETAINKMLEMRQQVADLRESEGQRQKILEELRADEKKYRTIVENIPERLYVKDRNSVYVFCSEKFAADLELKPQEIFGKTDYDLFPKEWAEESLADDQRIMAAGQVETTEDKYNHEGQTFIVQTVKGPLRDQNGDTIGVLAIVWDTTEQKRNEEELRKNCSRLEELLATRTAELEAVNQEWQKEAHERQRFEEQFHMAEEMYQTVLEGSGAAALVLEEDMLISRVNGEFERLCGIPKEEVIGKKSLREFLVPSEVEPVRSGPAARPDSDSVIRPGEGRFTGAGGEVRDVRITAARIPRTRQAVISLLDITDCKQAERSLQALREIYRALVENAKEAIMVMQSGWLKVCSPKILGISGYSENELLAQPFQEFIHPEDRESFARHVGNQEPEAPSQVQAFRLVHKDGQIRWMEERETRILWEQNPAVLCFLTDVTDRKQAEEEVRNSIEPFRALIRALERFFQL